MSRIEQRYNNMAEDLFVKKALSGEIAPYTKRAYRACKAKLPGMTLEQFAAMIANFNPGRCGIGQEAQIETLREIRYPNIVQLKDRSIKLHRNSNGSTSIVEENGRSNINGIKSFDAIIPSRTSITFCMLKTCSIGKFSTSIGGGHQDNVRDEIVRIIEVIGNRQFTFGGRSVKFLIVVDGRMASNIIDEVKPLIRGNRMISISSCEELEKHNG